MSLGAAQHLEVAPGSPPKAHSLAERMAVRLRVKEEWTGPGGVPWA